MMPHVLVLPEVDAPELDQAYLPESQWEKIPSTRLVRADTGNESTLLTEVGAAWSVRGLHVRFCCSGSLPLEREFSQNTEQDVKEEAVAVFLDPVGERDDYMTLYVNPYGQLDDARIENRLHSALQTESDETWSCPGLHVRTAGKSDMWVVEFFIPFGGITPVIRRPSIGDRWTGNFYRLGSQPGEEIEAWQPVFSNPPDLHASEHFGILEFGPRAEVGRGIP